MRRHNNVAREWQHLNAMAHGASATRIEPPIYTVPDSSNSNGDDVPKEDRGDVAVDGFWSRQTTCIFDIRVTDADSASYSQKDTAKSLANQEREKKQKYLQACLDRRRHFTPLVFTVDGVPGVEAQRAIKHLAAKLSRKWGKTYSCVCGFVRSRISIALARSVTTCLRGSRDPTARANPPEVGDGVEFELHR